MTKVVFGIISAFQQPSTVSQLVAALGGRPVVIHHDFNQRPDFRIDNPNVSFVPEPAVTGWGTWGFCEAIVRTLEHCFEHVAFDYFQLLSPTCLPLRPIDEFEAYLDRHRFDGNIDLIELKNDPDVMMTFGWRFLASRGTVRLAGLRRARSWYFSRDVSSSHRSGLSVLTRSPRPGLDDPRATFAALATRLALDGWAGPTPFRGDFRPFVGSCWFGANRTLAQRIVRAGRDPSLQRFFDQLPNADESFFPTVIGNSGLRLGPSNHLINFFNETGNPHWLRPGDFERVVSSDAFFARKFPDDARAQIRLDVLDRQTGRRAPSAPGTRGIGKRRPRLAFGVLSGSTGPQTLAQLAAALAPCPLVLNHDFAQQPDFALQAPNVSFVARPQQTAVDNWSWTQGVLQLLQHCLNHVEFDYLQLLSPLCLPIRPVSQFAEHVAASEVDAHANLIEVSGEALMMTFGHRLYAADGSGRRQWLENARARYFGNDPLVSQRAGVRVFARRGAAVGVRERLALRLATLGTQLRASSLLATVPPDPHFAVYAGAPWFGATREVCEYLLKKAADADWAEWFGTLNAGGDLAFATLLGNSGFRLGPSNHAFSPVEGVRERWLAESDRTWLAASGAFFARKFSHDPESPARLRQLAALQVDETSTGVVVA